MNQATPKISIITATWNCESTVQQCIESYKSQQYENKELIVIDGDSTDKTIDIIKANTETINKWISEPDRGIYNALNKGIAMANGDIIGFLHADDFFNDQLVLSRIADAFTKMNIDAVYGDLVYIDKDIQSKIVRTWISKPFKECMLDNGWMPPHPTLYVRSTHYKTILGFDESYKISADYDSIHRLFRIKNFKSYYINEILIRMRTGGSSNKSLRNIFRKTTEDFSLLRKNGYSFYQAAYIVINKNIRKLCQFI